MEPRLRRPRSLRARLAALAAAAALLFAALSVLVPLTSAGVGPAAVRAAANPLSVTNFGFSPSTITSGSSTQVSVSVSGGVAPYELYFNQTPPGCTPSPDPAQSTGGTFTASCNPTSTGSFTVRLDVVDSSSPPLHANSQTATLTVNSNNGNGNGNGNGGNGSGSSGKNGSGGFSFPSGLLSLALFGGIAFLAVLVAIAAGTIATAVAVSRRLRKLTEVLERAYPPPKDPKPPT